MLSAINCDDCPQSIGTAVRNGWNPANVAHEYGVGVLFILALALFTASLVNLARETRIALHDLDHFR